MPSHCLQAELQAAAIASHNCTTLKKPACRYTVHGLGTSGGKPPKSQAWHPPRSLSLSTTTLAVQSKESILMNSLSMSGSWADTERIAVASK